MSDGIVTGDAAATGQVATVIGDAVLHDPVVHVKLWSQDGTILYSDELKAIGKKFESGASELDELSPGQTSAEISDLRRPRIDTSRARGRSSRSTHRSRHPKARRCCSRPTSGTRASTEQRATAAARLHARARRGARSPSPCSLLPARLDPRAARPHARSREREEAVAARDRIVGPRAPADRRRPARRPGAGAVRPLDAAVGGRPSVRRPVASKRRCATRPTAVRGSVRTLRSAIVGVYPPNLQAAGLGPALCRTSRRALRHAKGSRSRWTSAGPGGYGTGGRRAALPGLPGDPAQRARSMRRPAP